MKKICVLTIILLGSGSLYSQDKPDKYTAFIKDGIEYKTDGKDTIVIVDPMPEFKGGKEKLVEYMSNNVKYPKTALKDKVEGKVLVSFIVASDGTIEDTKILKGIRQDLDNEALRVIKKMPKWLPGKQHGKAIRVSYSLPINFRL